MLYPSAQKADSKPARELAKNKQPQMRIIFDFFFSFSKYIPKMNRRDDIIPDIKE